MEWESFTKVGRHHLYDDDILQIPTTWIFPHYYEALNVLFRVENALRVFVYLVLKSEFGEKWVDISLQGDEGKSITISSVSKRRVSQSSALGHIGLPNRCAVMELTSGELIRLMLADSQWPSFKPYFEASREVIRLKLEEITAVRNALAHFRAITQEDVDTVKKNAGQVLRKVEQTLQEILSLETAVPTNNQAEWYCKLSGLQSDHFRIGFHQGSSGKWISVTLSYTAEVLWSRMSHKGGTMAISNIMTPAILTLFPEIRTHVTCVLDASPCSKWSGPPVRPNLTKRVEFIFRKDVLEKHCPDAEFRELRSRLFEETELVTRDNQASGTLIKISECAASKHGDGPNPWCVALNELCSPPDGAASEFLGPQQWYQFGFICGTHRFPWMASDISR